MHYCVLHPIAFWIEPAEETSDTAENAYGSTTSWFLCSSVFLPVDSFLSFLLSFPRFLTVLLIFSDC